MSFIKIVVEQPPSKDVCPAPEVSPGSSVFCRTVYCNLPEGLTVRNPTSCSWSGAFSSFDLDNLHFDEPRPESTEIKVSGGTLTMKGTGNLDLWTHGRRGAPMAWSDAPTDETYTFEVDCLLICGPAVSFLWCQCTMVLMVPIIFLSRSASRTWSGNGVGILNMGLQDYVQDATNPGFGEDPFEWQRFRVVCTPRRCVRHRLSTSRRQ